MSYQLKSLILCSIFYTSLAWSNDLTIKISLSPAGSFEAKTSKLKGSIKRDGNSFIAENLWVKIDDLQTGISLRDEHFKKHLNFEKYPKISLTNVKAQNGKGSGTLNVNNTQKTIQFTYKQLSESKLQAEFTTNAKDFGLKEAKYMEIGVDNEVVIVANIDL